MCDKNKLRWTVGNDCKELVQSDGSRRFQWRLFLDHIPSGLVHVERAVAHLHPTFQPAKAYFTRDIDSKSNRLWTLPRIGWGTFTVRIEVDYYSKSTENTTSVTLFHELDFSSSSSENNYIGNDLSRVPEMSQAPKSSLLKIPPSVSTANHRTLLTKLVSTVPFQDHTTSEFWHGRLMQDHLSDVKALDPPTCTWKCLRAPRDDHEVPKWLTASEFEDPEKTLEAKCSILAELIRCSRKTVVYSGAGISVAAGIGQAARGNLQGSLTTTAQPTISHWCLGELSRHGLLHGWIQQNHDGLPQKAGFPQELINEVHGSWYDPSNPVVKYSGSLKHENYKNMIDTAETADLVIVLGTSLCGLNADQVAVRAAERSLTGQSLGMVIINLQQTQQDGKASLRIFGRTDAVLPRLLTMLDISIPTVARPAGCDEGQGPKVSLPAQLSSSKLRIAVPYDAHGRRLEIDAGSAPIGTYLDLRPGARIRLTDGHNIQGAQQDCFMHIGASKTFVYKGIERQPGDGTGVVRKVIMNQSCISIRINDVHMRLGIWWLDVARRGAVETLPIVNVEPERVSISLN